MTLNFKEVHLYHESVKFNMIKVFVLLLSGLIHNTLFHILKFCPLVPSPAGILSTGPLGFCQLGVCKLQLGSYLTFNTNTLSKVYTMPKHTQHQNIYNTKSYTTPNYTQHQIIRNTKAYITPKHTQHQSTKAHTTSRHTLPLAYSISMKSVLSSTKWL